MIEAMKQALEALEEIVKWYGVRDKNDVMMPPLNQNPEIKESMDAITVLRQAIEQAERQETNQVTLTQTNIGIGERGMEAYEAAKERGWVGLSDERLMEMPKQEPVAKVAEIHLSRYTIEWVNGPLPEGTPLYTHPKEWQDLTDEERLNFLNELLNYGTGFVSPLDAVVRAIEAKLKEKNT